MKKIKLTQGKHALVDDEDFERINMHAWTASFGSRNTKWYAIRRAKKHETEPGDPPQRRVAMHREILNCPEGLVVDHINGDSLDNRKQNLQIVTQRQNMLNAAGWKRANA